MAEGKVMGEKTEAMPHEEGVPTKDAIHATAERGHVAMDRYGNALVTFDQALERKLRLKIDLFVIPTVSVLYLFCFINRANIDG
ncbi:MAG: hypothetical protein MMC23_009594 [Stictis urceolatum]|nr:hypothetical protein [Stictis urceolata]